MSRIPAALALTSLVLVVGCSRIEKAIGRAPPEAVGSSQAAAPHEAPTASTAPASPPAGYVRMAVGGVTPTTQGNALFLVDTTSHMAVPIFIGDTEALSIQLRLDKRKYERPLTHDLLDSMVRKLDGKVASVRVDKLENNVFYGTVVLRRGDQLLEFDARSSDAVALAVGNDVPIDVAKTVVKQAGVSLDDVHGPSMQGSGGAGPERPEGVAL